MSSYNPTFELLSQLWTETPPSRSTSPRLPDIERRYDKLKVLADERRSMLETFMLSLCQYNASRAAWEDLLCDLEKQTAALPPGATPQKEIKVNHA